MFEHETTWRLSAFIIAFIILAIGEVLFPRRPLALAKTKRWFHNLTLLTLDVLLLRLIFPMASVGAATMAAENNWGLLNHASLPAWSATISSVIILDLAIYFQHRIFHAVPLLWRIHRVHHADLDFDMTTGLRFHPIEIILSMCIKFSVIAVLGPPLLAVLIFELLLNIMAMFNHSNIKLHLGFDRVLRRLLVTPDMHRVHHSVKDDELNSNFGFNLACWDALFRTYKDQPQQGHNNMLLGLNFYRETWQVANLWAMLMLPFRKKHKVKKETI